MEVEQSRNKKRKIVGIISIVLLALLALGCFIYINDYYHAGDNAVAVMETVRDVEIKEINDDVYAFIPENPKAGLIFYPGGKVEYKAYAPLMMEFARNDILCILPKMPGNLAVFGIDKAKGMKDLYPQIDKWYMGGHSLGGAMAASYLYSYRDEYEGLLLFGAYSNVSLKDSSLKVVCVYGSEDKVMNPDDFKKYRDNLPDDAVEHVIEGGCHSYFGDYGMQDGDGVPTITRDEQVEETVGFCSDLMLK